MAEKLKRLTLIFMILTLAAQSFIVRVASAENISFGDVVINEIAWAGSNDGAGDEWIELYNNSDHDINLRGWSIDDDGSSSYEIEEGVIKAKHYFVIEDKGNTVLSLETDHVIGLSLANSGDSLMLRNEDGIPIDIVNSEGENWYAGNANSKASMERVDPLNFIDSVDNWSSATFSNGAISSGGSEILGTPGSVNSAYDGSGPRIILNSSEQYLVQGEEFEVVIEVEEANEMFAYGFEIKYDQDDLQFVSASEGDFLGDDGYETAFNGALKNGQEGNLLLAGTRLGNDNEGANGNGEVLRLSFAVLAENNGDIAINFSGESFVSDIGGEIPVSFKSAIFSVSDGVVNTVEELEIREGEQRYSLELSWETPDGGADSYLVTRKNHMEDYVIVAEVNDAVFVDDWNIVPNIDYKYKIIPVKAGAHGQGMEITGNDPRGLTGDNNRDDIVDGRDLENLARKFASEFGEENYEQLLDMNLDGVIDGSDLIDLGVNFGLVY